MSERVLYRGDHYVLRRQVYVITLVDDQLDPFDMTDCTIRSTFKTATTDPNQDPDDETAALKCDITFSDAGAVTSSNNFMLPEGGSASEGVLWLTADATATLALPLNTVLRSDVQVTDANGEHLTIPMVGTLRAIDGYTNRTEDEE